MSTKDKQPIASCDGINKQATGPPLDEDAKGMNIDVSNAEGFNKGKDEFCKTQDNGISVLEKDTIETEVKEPDQVSSSPIDEV